MGKKILFIALGILCLTAGAIMYNLRNDSHLSELGDYFWTPLPLGVLSIIMGIVTKKNN